MQQGALFPMGRIGAQVVLLGRIRGQMEQLRAKAFIENIFPIRRANHVGAGDQLGAANQLTPTRTLAALAMAKSGQILDISHVIENGAPFMGPNQTPYVIHSGATARNSMKIRAGLGATNEVGANLERVGMTMHVDTHIDALGHFSIGEHLYGGHNIDDSVGDFGLIDLGIENIPPLITRGLCLDLSGLDGGEHLAAGRSAPMI
ncbi:MAG: cyclase family protein [Alphaproteobacteria bacterium]|nr:cyclase family protein [Alphaproteobacteria bacterium]